MPTTFCSCPVYLRAHGHRFTIHVDGNSKIALNPEGYIAPTPSAFSLPAPSCCPGATPECTAVCYTQGLRKKQPELAAEYFENERAMHAILALDRETRDALASQLGRWITENAPFGFRWHVSGDVFSEEYARWIVAVCAHSPDVPHWIYTRSFFAVPILVAAPNLAVNVSLDAGNWDDLKGDAQFALIQNTARACWMASAADEEIPPLPKDSVIFPVYSLRQGTPDGAVWYGALSKKQARMVCPADYFGQSESMRCATCRRCLGPVR